MDIVILQDLLDASSAWDYLINREFPPKIAYRLKVVGRKIDRGLRDYREEADKITEGMSELSEEKGEEMWKIPMASLIEHKQQIRELLQAEFDPPSKLLREKDFLDALEGMGEDRGTIRASVFIQLWFIFEEEEE